MIRQMIILSIFSGIWTALFSLLVMITVSLHFISDVSCAQLVLQYLGFPDTAIYVVFDLPLCSLYFNTLLANLNSRDRGTVPSLREVSTFRAATRPITLSTFVGLQDSQFDEERDSIETMDWK